MFGLLGAAVQIQASNYPGGGSPTFPIQGRLAGGFDLVRN
jgi:hypothetical protein